MKRRIRVYLGVRHVRLSRAGTFVLPRAYAGPGVQHWVLMQGRSLRDGGGNGALRLVPVESEEAGRVLLGGSGPGEARSVSGMGCLVRTGPRSRLIRLSHAQRAWLGEVRRLVRVCGVLTSLTVESPRSWGRRQGLRTSRTVGRPGFDAAEEVRA